jgi:hypothetical protein
MQDAKFAQPKVLQVHHLQCSYECKRQERRWYKSGLEQCPWLVKKPRVGGGGGELENSG